MTTHHTDPSRGESPENVDPSENRQNQEQAMRAPEKYLHTPGPWYFADCMHPSIVIRTKDREIVPHIYPSGDGVGKANARLIAQSPRLLAILESIVEMNPELPMGMIEEAQSAIRDSTTP